MSVLSLGLILLSAYLHATWNYLSKKAQGGLAFMWLFSAVASLVYLPLLAGIFLFRGYRPTVNQLPYLAGSILLHLLYFQLLFQGYRIGDLTVMYPISRGSAPLFTTLSAIFLLGERPGLTVGTGVVLIAAGIFFLSGGNRALSGTAGTRQLLYGLLIGVTICAYSILDKAAVGKVLVPPLVLDYFNTLGRMLLLTPYAIKNREQVREQWQLHRREAIGVGVFNSLGYLLVLTAMVVTPVSVVAPLREVSILFGMAWGVKALGERPDRRQLAAAGVLVSGVVMIALS